MAFVFCFFGILLSAGILFSMFVDFGPLGFAAIVVGFPLFLLAVKRLIEADLRRRGH